MLLEPAGAAASAFPDSPSDYQRAPRWGVASETGRLTDVLLSAPTHLSMVPCNAVTRDSLAKGLACSPGLATRQHRRLVETLEAAGVRCHFAPSVPGLADLTFTRDAVMMSPWGLIELRPAAAHRRAESRHVAAAAAALGIPRAGRIEQGAIEGGDICLLRPGLLLVGHSGDRTDEAGSRALGALFERRGWEVIYAPFAPRFLHLDTVFTMLSDSCAVALTDALGDRLLDRLAGLGIGIIPASAGEAAGLGANLLSLGRNRIVTPGDNHRLNHILRMSGFTLIEVEIDQFTRCGGGVHCLTLPLAREPDRQRG